MCLGLISRTQYVNFPGWIDLYLGDALWALMVFWLMCVLRPNANTQYLLLSTLIFAFFIECSQLYQAPWINALRHTTIGALVLGFGFKWTDLIAYTLGASTGAMVNYILVNFSKNQK